MNLSIDGEKFVVLANAVGQYSIWPADAAVPPGWKVEGPPECKDDCLEYIERVWTQDAT
jgi:MbtH protein